MDGLPKLYISILIIVCLNSVYVNGQQMNFYSGVVEGFYWPNTYSVNGQYGSYSATQRNQLIQLLADNGIGVYWYAAQKPIDTMALWNKTELAAWNATQQLASKLGVRVVYGLRPGWLDTDTTNIATRLTQISSVGIRYYSLNFDDAEGVTTTEQQTREKTLVSSLATSNPTMTLWGFTPAYYYMETTRSTWNQNLQTIDGIASTIPMIFTGESITESTFDSSKFPNLQSNRPLVVWDNWIAEDTNTRIPWGMIDQRIANNMFASPYGYILNLCYPLERVIHHIYCLGKIAKVSSVAQPQPKCDVTQTGSYWSTWLNQNGFLHNNQNVNTVATGLTAAINDDQFYESIAQFEAANPTLQGIFSTPPTPTTTTTTNTTTSTTSTSPTSTSTTGKTTTTTNSPTTTTTSTPTATTGTTTTTTNSTTTTTGTTTTTTTASTTTTTDSSTTSDVNESNKMTYNILLILTFLILLIIN